MSKFGEKPANYEQMGTARLGGRFTSKGTQEQYNLVPGTVDKPNSYVIKPAVSDDDFIEAFQNNAYSPERVQEVINVQNMGLRDPDIKIAVGTAISVGQGMERTFLQKTKDRKTTTAQTLSPAQIIEYAGNPWKWTKDIWWLERPPCMIQESIAKTNESMLVLAARQIFGKTTMIAISKVAHSMIFKPGTRILVATNQERSAKNFVDVVRVAIEKYASLCGFITITKNNEKEIALDNGSLVMALSQGSAAPRGFTAHILVLDEAAFISDDRFFKELYPTTASIDKPIIIASTTPNGKQGWFYQYWNDNKWPKMFAVDTDCTWKPQSWFDKTKQEVTDTAYRQEYKCEFLDVQNAVFTVEQIDSAMEDFPTWDLKNENTR